MKCQGKMVIKHTKYCRSWNPWWMYSRPPQNHSSYKQLISILRQTSPRGMNCRYQILLRSTCQEHNRNICSYQHC